ncbi:MAG: hypothetical protein WAZ45_04475, partial [Gemmiger qucibialis]
GNDQPAGFRLLRRDERIAPYNRSNALSQYVKHVTIIFFQNPLSKKTARTTAYHTVYGQLIYGNTA